MRNEVLKPPRIWVQVFKSMLIRIWFETWPLSFRERENIFEIDAESAFAIYRVRGRGGLPAPENMMPGWFRGMASGNGSTATGGSSSASHRGGWEYTVRPVLLAWASERR